MSQGAIAAFAGSRSPGRALLAVAAPSEARAALRAWGAAEALAAREWEAHRLSDRLDLVVTGISKANAAGAVARLLAGGGYDAVLSAGVAGTLPGADLPLGTVVLADISVFADEGLETPHGFRDCAAMGFPLTDAGLSCPGSPGLLDALAPLVDARGPIATVSICSGTDSRARDIRERTGAIAEGMEGAAVGVAARRSGVAFAEVRAISNTTGDRERQVWDLSLALEGISRVIGRL